MEVRRIDLVEHQNLLNLFIVLVFWGDVEGFSIFVEEYFLFLRKKYVCGQILELSFSDLRWVLKMLPKGN